MGPNGHAHTPEPHADKKPLLEFSHKGHSLSTYAELTHPVVLDLNVFGALDVRLCPMDQFFCPFSVVRTIPVSSPAYQKSAMHLTGVHVASVVMKRGVQFEQGHGLTHDDDV